MNEFSPTSGPHTHSNANTNRIMYTVLLALLPSLAFGIYNFGWPAFNVAVLTIVSALIAEVACLYIAKKAIQSAVLDGSALLTAILLAMSIPPWAPWWIAVFGGLFAIIIGKHIFGGVGQNVFNPAMLSRVALLVAFPLEMTTWVKPAAFGAAGSPGFIESLSITFGENLEIDTVSSATVLGGVKTGFTQESTIDQTLSNIDYNLLASLWGHSNGSLGETSAILILLGGLFLLYKRIITWHIPVAMVASLFLLSSLFNLINPDRYLDFSVHLFNGGFLLAAFFIATDPVTSPSSKTGQLVFGAGCGALDFIIRSWGGYPEGIGFAILLMNSMTPLIDHYIRPRIYGRTRNGKAVETSAKVEKP